jgi:hypothetical protein
LIGPLDPALLRLRAGLLDDARRGGAVILVENSNPNVLMVQPA